MPDPQIIDNDRVVISDTGDASTYHLTSGSDTVIHAWNVTVRGKNTSPGRNLTIVANTVIFDTGAFIDTSGTAGADVPNIKLPTPTTAGVPGIDGQAGNSGEAAGSITLVARDISYAPADGGISLNTRGGMGGRGQDGGDGATGAPGPPDNEVVIHYTSEGLMNPPPAGFPGGAGGNAGSAGVSGSGGSGGNITVTSANSPDLSASSTLAGGAPGPAALPGNPGSGGQGGSGPLVNIISGIPQGGPANGSTVEGGSPSASIVLPDSGHQTTVAYHAGPGPQGPTGKQGTAFVGNAGVSGQVIRNVYSDAALAAVCTVGQVRKVLAAAEYAYLNDNIDEAWSRVRWVSTIASLLAASGAAALSPDDTSLSPPLSPAYDFENALPLDAAGLAERANRLDQQMQHGFSYYGYPRNYVPLLSYDFFKTEMQTILTNAVIIDQGLQAVVTAAQAAQLQEAQIDQAIAQATALVGQLSGDLNAALADANDLQTQINALMPQIDVLKQQLLDSEAEYNDAVKAATDQGCGLSDLVVIVGAIVAVASAVFTAGTSTLALIAAIGSSGFKIYQTVTVKQPDGTDKQTKELNPTYTALFKVAGNLADVYAGYQKLKAAMAANASEDSGRLMLTQQDMDAKEADFNAKVDQATQVDIKIREKLKAQAHAYLAAVQARNKKIADRDGAILKIWDLNTQILQNQATIDKLANDRATNTAPDLIAYTRMFQKIQSDFRLRLRFLVWQEMRAGQLWSLEEPGIISAPSATLNGTPVSENLLILGATASDLLLRHTLLSANYLTARASQAGGPQKIEPDVVLSIELTPEQKSFLTKNRKLVFNVDFDSLVDSLKTEVYMTEFSVDLPGVAGFSGEIQHSGRQAFLRRDGKRRVEYASASLIREIVNTPSPTFVLSDWGYLGVSPFTDWILTAGPNVSTDVLNEVQTIEIKFGGWFQPLVP